MKELNIKNLSDRTEVFLFTKQVIKRGGIAICPTDTVYGVIADAQNQTAVARVFLVKKRPSQKALPVFVRDIASAKRLANINRSQELFLKKFWPGKLTAVLEARNDLSLPGGILNNGKIGLRVPDYQFLNILLEELDIPLVATSANISGRDASAKITRVIEQFAQRTEQPDLIINAGDLKDSPSSTVIDLVSLKMLREGAISKKEISDVLDI